MESLFDTILAKAREIHDPFEQAFFAMVHLPLRQAIAKQVADMVPLQSDPNWSASAGTAVGGFF